MTDPKRLLDQVNAGSLEHQLLSLGQRLEPPPGAIDQGWAGISAAIFELGSATAAGSTAAGGGTLKLLANAGALKALVVGAALGTGVMGSVPLVRWVAREERTNTALPARHEPVERTTTAIDRPKASPRNDERPERAITKPLATHSMPQSRRPEVVITPESYSGPEPAEPVSENFPKLLLPEPLAGGVTENLAVPASEAATPATALPGATLAPTAPPSAVLPSTTQASGLRAEALELAKARNLLEAGQVSGALALLGASQQRFAGGALVQEREALIVDALVRRGDREAARRRAQAFLSRFPNSPLAEKIRELQKKIGDE